MRSYRIQRTVTLSLKRPNARALLQRPIKGYCQQAERARAAHIEAVVSSNAQLGCDARTRSPELFTIVCACHPRLLQLEQAMSALGDLSTLTDIIFNHLGYIPGREIDHQNLVGLLGVEE